ncbi:hypothetical protein RND81_10G186900 [Saponaria officinalis]
MVIGDGILTPTMSVLSAVSGMKIKLPYINKYHTASAAIVIVIFIFSLQHFGTKRVGFLFAPILVAWLLCVAGVGLYNIIHWNPGVIKAVSPYYAYKFLRITGKVGWSSLGGVVLCITGAEAMFADLGHFSPLSLRIAFVVFVYPCLVLGYMGEAAYFSKNQVDLQSSFYKAIPEPMFWPVFAIATLATIVASQAIISATFSIISQCRALKCFPRVKIVHTCNDIYGRIYIPEINWILMLLCIAVVIEFSDTPNQIGNAYGLDVISVMFVTTCLMFLIIVVVWKKNVILGIMFVLTFGSVELVYLSAAVTKIPAGGWVPLVSSLVILCLMSVWKYGTILKQDFEGIAKFDMVRLLNAGPDGGVQRVRGIGLVYSNLVGGIPPMFSHFVINFPAFHEVLVFVTLETTLIPRVPPSERFVISREPPVGHLIFRCVVKYGYKDFKDADNFETQLMEKVEAFLEHGPSTEEERVSNSNQSPPPPPPPPPNPGLEQQVSSGDEAEAGGVWRRVSYSSSDVSLRSVSVGEPAATPVPVGRRRVTYIEMAVDPSSSTQVRDPSSSTQVRDPSSSTQVRFRDPSSSTQVRDMGDPSSSTQVRFRDPSSSTQYRDMGDPSSSNQVRFRDPSSSNQVRFRDPSSSNQVRFRDDESPEAVPERVIELQKLRQAKLNGGVAYMIGNTRIEATVGSSFLKKFAINFIYKFLRQNCRHPAVPLGIPHTSLIEVGIIYRI